jgi:hypothetical protein
MWSYATASDIDEFYNGRPRESLRAVTVHMDGRPMLIIGIAKEPDRDRLFSEYKPEFAPYLKRMPVMRALKRVMSWVESSKVPVYAISEGTGILQRLGFKHETGPVYFWKKVG